MHILTDPKKVVASAVISELQSSDIYLTLKARLFDLRANLNGVRVTEAFLDEIVENESKYVCHPLYADIRGLIASKTIGHMYNKRTGEFYSTQIGAFYHFEKEVDGDNAHLIGYARVPKRNKAVCKALSDLFTDNALKFSFELNCRVYEEDEDGTMVIDANPGNYWEGECVVTFPACETAVAQELIAECLSKGDENMADENIVNAESEVIAEEVEQSEAVVAETEVAETEVAETEVAETEVAETVYVTQQHTEIDTMRTYNDETGEEVEQRVAVETVVHIPVHLAEEEAHEEDEHDQDEANDEEVVAENEVSAACDSENEEDKDPEEDDKEVAEQEFDWAMLIAELRDDIAKLRTELAELRAIPEDAAAVIAEEILSENEPETVIAETAAEPLMNPFMASISAPKKYSLLDKEEKSTRKYSLL